MTKWEVVYYTDTRGSCPVKEFIDSRTAANQAKIMAFIALLEERGPNLPRPYADLLRDGIHELRLKLSGDQMRILYFFAHRRRIVLSHFFRKNAAKVPNREILRAATARDDFLRRHPG